MTSYEVNDVIKKINLVFMNNKRTNGRKVIKDFTLDKIAVKILPIYKNVLKKYQK